MIEPQRRSLQVVAHAGANPTAIDNPTDDTSGGVEYLEGRDEWRARSVIRQWSPEHQLVGALMYMSAEDARPVLELVPDSALGGPSRASATANMTTSPTSASVTPSSRFQDASRATRSPRIAGLLRSRSPASFRGNERP